jgi:hypothetical protein
MSAIASGAVITTLSPQSDTRISDHDATYDDTQLAIAATIIVGGHHDLPITCGNPVQSLFATFLGDAASGLVWCAHAAASKRSNRHALNSQYHDSRPAVEMEQ